MKFLSNRITFRRRLSVLCAIALFGGFISPLSPMGTASASANSTTSCGDFAAGVDFGDLRVKSLHGKAFYTDFKNGLNATYIGYEITNDTVTALDNIWVQVGNFRAVSGTSVLNLVNNADAAQPVIPPSPTTTPVGRVPASGKSFVYFLLKASDVSVNAQRHDVRIFRGNPANGGVAYGASYNCFYELQAVKRTLAASANKVTAVSVSASPRIGGAVTVTVNGATGVAGSGDSTLDGDAMWLSPASASTWPTRVLRLETVSVAVKYRKNDPDNKIVTFPNSLLLTRIACSGGGGGCTKFTSDTTYVATYTFRIVGSASSNPEVKPTAQISSGTQMKHTGSYPTTIAVVDVTNPARTVTVAKEVNNAVAITKSGSNFLVGYKVTLTNSDTSDVVVDEVLDIPQNNVTLQTGSVRVVDKYRTSATALNPEPTTKDSQGRYHFTGPFTVAAKSGATNGTATLTYVMVIPEPTDYSIPIKNTAYGAIGSSLFGSSLDTSVVKECGLALTSDNTSSSSSCIDTAVAKLPQTITFPQPPNQGGGTSYTLDANSDSGLQVSYRIVSGACVLSGLTVIYQAEGTCVIEATQSGNTTYEAATPVQRSVVVLPQQVITFAQPPVMTTSSSQTVTVTASSGLPVTLTTLDTSICKVGATAATAAESFTPTSGNSFVIASYSLRGNCPLVATQAGDGVNYGAAVPVERTVGVGLSTQVLTTIGTAPPATTNSNSNANWDVSPRIGTSSGTLLDLPVEFTSLTPSVCTAGIGVKNGGTYAYYRSNITWTTTGLCVVQADQDGLDANGVQSAYAAAEPITTSFTIGAVPIVTIETAASVKSGATFDVTVVVARPAGGTGAAPTGTLTLFTSGSALSDAQQSSAVLVENVSGVSNKRVFSVNASNLPATGESGHISLFATFTSSGANSYTNSQTVSASDVEVYSPAAVLVTPTAFSVERNATVNATVTVIGNSTYGSPQGTSTVIVTGGTVGGTMPVTLSAEGTATVTLTAGSDASADMVVNASYTPTGSSTTYFDSQSGSVTALANRTVDIFQRFTVKYETHGGTETFDDALVLEGSSTTLPTPTRANSGYTTYTFNGWYTAQNAGDKIGNAGASYTPTADITLHAQWIAAIPNFTVTYNLHGGTGTLSPVTNPAGTEITLPSPTRANSTYGTFTFNGWYTAQSGGTLEGLGGAKYTPTANITLHAQWTEVIPSYTVTYNLHGGSGTLNPVTHAAGTSIELPTPTRANSGYTTYSFTGWYTAASGGSLEGLGGASFTVTSDITLHAQWTAVTPDFTVTYNLHGGTETLSPVTNPAGTEITLPTPTRANSTYGTFTFNGWYTAASGGTREGLGGAKYTPSANITLHAQWTENIPNRTVTYNPEGGTVLPTSATTQAGTSLNLPTPLRTSTYGTFTFLGWFTTSTAPNGIRVGGGDDPYLVEDDITLYARWTETIPDRTVIYDPHGGSVSPSSATVQSGTSVTLPTPTRTSTYGSFAFDGWYTASNGGELVGVGAASYTVTADVTLHAQWTENIPNKTVTYVLNGGSGTLNPVTNPAGTSITLPTPTRANSTYGTFAFDGWFTEATAGNLVAAGGATYLMTADVTLHAQWTETIADRTVTYNAHGGTVSPSSVSVQPATSVTLPSPTRANSTYGTFTFNGWYTAASAGELVGVAGDSYTVTANITLHAQWTENIPNETVTYNPEGGTVLPTSATTQAGSSLNLPTPIRASTYGTFTFNGWYTAATGGTRIGGGGSPYTVTADITLHAQWTETIPNRTVTFNAQGGVLSPTSSTVQSGAAVTLPTPTRTSTYGTFTFDGWYTAATDGTLIGAAGASYTVTADITLFAQWTETVPDFTVNFDPQGGTVSPASKTARAGTEVSLPTPSAPASAPASELVGWFTEATAGTRVGGTDSLYTLTANNVTLYARWDEPVATAATLYTVTFDANGASGTPSLTSLQQSAGGTAIQLATVGTMTHKNYEFVGWATNRSATTAEFDAGSSGYIPTSNETLFAVWRLIPGATFDLTGYVWLDLNANGVLDAGERRLPGVPLTIVRSSSGVQSASMRVRSSSTKVITDADGGYSFTGLSVGDWKLNIEIPESLQVTKNSDGTSTAFVNVSLPRTTNAPVWIGTTGSSTFEASVLGLDDKPINETVQLIWEGIDGKFDTDDDVVLDFNPQSNSLKNSRLPAGRYRLVRLGDTPTKSECAGITLVNQKVVTATIRTQPGDSCTPDATTAADLPSSNTASVAKENESKVVATRAVQADLPDTGMGHSTMTYLIFISLLFVWAGTTSVTVARRRRRENVASSSSR